MAAVAAVAGRFAEAAMAPHSACAPSPLQLEEQQGSDFGDAQSGKSETIAEALLHGLHDRAVTPTIPSSQEQLEPTAASAEVQGSTQNSSHDMSSTPVPEAAAEPAAAEAAAGPQGGVQEGDVDLLVPLSPPDESEGPEAAAEYERYLARWEEGQTLAQRWHRLAQQGKLCDIQEEWEDWQLDLMLTQVKQRTTTALTQQGKAPAGGLNGSLLCSTRLRRGRGEVQEADDSPNEEPRRVRSRRAPATLQDFHVNAAAAAATAKTPERTPEGCDPTHTPAAAAAAAANGSHSSAGSYRQQQQPSPQTGRDAASEESTDEAADNVTTRALDQQQQTVGSTGGVAVQSQQQQQAQQQSATRPPGRRGPLPQAPPKRVVTRVQRGGSVPHAATSGSTSRQYNRVITPYNPQLVQQQQMEAQAQQMMAVMQEQQQVAAAAAMAGVSPEMLDEFYAMGSRLGAAFGQGQGEGGSAGGLAQNPAAMAAFMHALYSYGNPTAIAQQVAGVMGGQQ